MLYRNFNALRNGAMDVLLLIVRLWLANIFLRSGILKLQSWDTTLALFETEYHVPFLPANIAAIMGASAEIIGGALVLVGFVTPIGAAILFGVTLVIELFVFPGTTDHYHWLMLLALLMIKGGGAISVDKLLFPYFIRNLKLGVQ